MSEDDGEVVSWRRMLESTAQDVGRPQARWLCEQASGYFGDDFLAITDDAISIGAMNRLQAMLERVRSGEPLQYVLGHWSFRSLDLFVDRRVLIPRPETEMVAEHAIRLAREISEHTADRPLVVVDLGTGSGAIGLSLAQELPRGLVEVWLTDVSVDALDVARANLAGLGMAGQGVRCASGNWFNALPPDLSGSLAMVVSNPPYVDESDPAVDAAVRDWEPASAVFAADGGLADLREIVIGAADWLRPGGWLVAEIGSTQRAPVLELLEVSGFVDSEVVADLAGRDRIAVGRRPSR